MLCPQYMFMACLTGPGRIISRHPSFALLRHVHTSAPACSECGWLCGRSLCVHSLRVLQLRAM